MAQINQIDFKEELIKLGVHAVSEIAVSDIVFEPSFRTLCEQNSCGCYGRNYGCPPFVGEADELIANAKKYQRAIVYQTVGDLEDSYDIEGMNEHGQKHYKLCLNLSKLCKSQDGLDYLNLANGGCRTCETCGAVEGSPCRAPESVLPSIDTYCIYVTQLAEAANLNYINGQNTVTYFGMLLLKD